MVLALFVLIGIMVVDRVLYSSHAFISRKAVAEKLDTDSPLITSDPANSSDSKSNISGDKIKTKGADYESERDYQNVTEEE